MDEYEVQIARSARKEIEALDALLVARIIAAIEALARTPRPRGCRKLRGAENLWRIRVGDYRVIYSIDDENRIVRVAVVRHRREAYE